MAIDQETRRWEAYFAQRTRAGAGEGLIAILALAGQPEGHWFESHWPR